MIHEIVDNLGFIKIQTLCSAKDNVKRIRRQAIDWEKIFTKGTSNQGLPSKVHIEL